MTQETFSVDGIGYTPYRGYLHVYVRQMFALLEDGCLVGKSLFADRQDLLCGVTIRLDCRRCMSYREDAHHMIWSRTVCERCWIDYESYGFKCTQHKKKGVPEDPFPPPKVESRLT